eukprot:scaffold32663_cov30-Tisochrysis_lutea.AAC.6
MQRRKASPGNHPLECSVFTTQPVALSPAAILRLKLDGLDPRLALGLILLAHNLHVVRGVRLRLESRVCDGACERPATAFRGATCERARIVAQGSAAYLALLHSRPCAPLRLERHLPPRLLWRGVEGHDTVGGRVLLHSVVVLKYIAPAASDRDHRRRVPIAQPRPVALHPFSNKEAAPAAAARIKRVRAGRAAWYRREARLMRPTWFVPIERVILVGAEPALLARPLPRRARWCRTCDVRLEPVLPQAAVGCQPLAPARTRGGPRLSLADPPERHSLLPDSVVVQ